MKSLRLSVFAVALVLAGCTASPTDAPLRDQAAPSLDEGGNTTGSGNRADGLGIVGSGNVESDEVTEDGGAAPPPSPAIPSDTTGTTGRGGNGLGSGN